MNALDFALQLPFSWRQRRVQAQRENMSRERFIDALAKDEFERHAAGFLWNKLVEAAVIPDFRPSPEDNFLYIYGLADEDFDEDVVLDILTSLGLPPPSQAVLQNIGQIASPVEFMQLVRQVSG